MKVVGRGSEGKGYILIATDDEVANLLGYYSGYHMRENVNLPISEINIADMYKQLYSLSSIEKRLNDASKSLLDVANSLVSPIPFKIQAQPDNNKE